MYEESHCSVPHVARFSEIIYPLHSIYRIDIVQRVHGREKRIMLQIPWKRWTIYRVVRVDVEKVLFNVLPDGGGGPLLWRNAAKLTNRSSYFNVSKSSSTTARVAL